MMLVMSSEMDLAALDPPSGKSDQGAPRKAQAMVALSPWRSPSAMIGLISSIAPASMRACLDTGHWARFRMTNREKSSSELEVHRLGGAVVFRMFPTTHLGMSVLPKSEAFSSDLARFLMRPHAQRTPSDFPEPDLGTAGAFLSSFSRMRMRDSELWRGGMGSDPSGTGECCSIVVMLASRKDRFMRQIQQRYDSCLSSAMTLHRPPMTALEEGPSAMTRLFSVGMDKLLSARHARCLPSPLS
mmetsp:Transcript_7433/g.13536  ORF Transcript_7433/g.13536 Transcript_7433/m.13536 type:complete len:243 (+) Transcript_7433:894-1622(+)